MKEDKKKKYTWDQWIRCGKYQIEEVKGKGFISPDIESGYIFYEFKGLQREKRSRRPDEDYLVQSLLNMDTSNKQDILDFVNTFGLLGLLQHNYLEPQSVLIDGKLQYFVPERNGEELHDASEIAERYLLDLEEFKSEGFYKVRRTMSEPIDAFIEAVDEFQEIGRYMHAIERAENGADELLRDLFRKDKEFKENAEEELVSIIPMAKAYAGLNLLGGNITINKRIKFSTDEKRWQSQWSFISLLSAAYFFLTEDFENNFWIGECPRCNNLYLSSVGSKIYCSRKCEDATRKAKSRKKKEKEDVNNGRSG